MNIEKNFVIERIWVRDGEITIVQFYIEFTDPDMPGVKSVHAAVIPAPQDLLLDATDEDIVFALLEMVGEQWIQDLDNFHANQLAFEYARQNDTIVERNPATTP